MPTLWKALRQKAAGAKRLTDAAVSRLAAGLTSADLRALARGDPLRRPDPRLAAHTRSFWLHIRPRYYHEAATRFTHTFRLGLLAVVLAAVEIVTGLLLMLYYIPSPDHAYGSIVRLVSEVPFGKLVRDLHRLGAEALLVVTALHMARTFLTGSYKPPRRLTWATGVGLLALVLAMSFSGYLLPWDQLAYWAVTVGAGLADYVPPPALGRTLQALLLGGPTVGADTLLRFYLLHVLVIPAAALALFAVHYFKVVRAGLSLPASEERVGEDTARRVPRSRRRYTIPDILVAEAVFIEVVAVVLLGAVVLGLYPGAPLEHHADPGRTPPAVAAPWYFLWLQGLVKLGHPTLTGVLVPAVLFLLLLALPYLDRNPSRRARDRRLAISLFLSACAALVVLTWLGRPEHGASLPPAEAVAQRIMPEEGVGPLRSLAWAELQEGEWDTRTVDLSTAGPALRSAVEGIARQIAAEDARARRAGAPGLTNGWAKLVITEWQPGLKKVALRLFWLAPDGTEQTFERVIFVHRAR
ncbi:MAG: cytochrome bc complex cytochrome b subunit [Caldilineales bacterium]|nr:cytochrome bc complex cytochrome b subunit [Caldilineales bacterium]MDW8319629.1 cytochrome bc complex cytochrome b subunit [Anaerolineae bacterium]